MMCFVNTAGSINVRFLFSSLLVRYQTINEAPPTRQSADVLSDVSSHRTILTRAVS